MEAYNNLVKEKLFQDNQQQKTKYNQKTSKISQLHKFSTINPHINRRIYYYKRFFPYKNLSKNSNYEYLLNQERYNIKLTNRKFIDLINDLDAGDELTVWLK